jgi:hypothetical protein
MLFGPENREQFRDPDMNRRQAVQAGMAGGADGDQEPRLAHAGLAMVNMELRVPCPAARTPVSIASEYDFPVTGEVISRVPEHPITLRAKSGDDRHSFAAGAKQRLLPGSGVRMSPQKAFSMAGEG